MAETVGLKHANAAGQLNVFGHDGDPLGVDGTQVGVLKQTKYASLVSCRTMTAELWKHRSVLKS